MGDNFLEDFEDTTVFDSSSIIKAPFGYPGGKSRSLEHILPRLPYRNAYIEPFGGSASVLLGRRPSRFEVYNDRYSGVVDFYRCVKDSNMLTRLLDLIDLSTHSKEEWYLYHDTWKDHADPVERAARWYLMTVYSFGQLGRNWGRATRSNTILSGKARDKLDKFHAIHERFKYVQIENADWSRILNDYDAEDAVFYLDPPYVDTYSGTYKNELSQADHRALLARVFKMQGIVAVSGYSNQLYEEQNWDERYEWEVNVSIKSLAFTEGNGKADLKNVAHTREKAKEVLWVKM